MAAFHARYALYRGFGACLLLLPLSSALASDLVTVSVQGHITYQAPNIIHPLPSIGVGTTFRATFTYDPSTSVNDWSDIDSVGTCNFNIGQYSISGPMTVFGLAWGGVGMWDCAAYSYTAPDFILRLSGDPALFPTLPGRILPTSVPPASLLNPLCYTNDYCLQVEIGWRNGLVSRKCN